MTFRDAPRETETPAPGPFGIPPEYFGPPDGEDAIRADELAASRIETRAMSALRTVLHDPATGFASRPPEERLTALPETLATIERIGESHRAEAATPRQRGILSPLLDNHLEHATARAGRLANQALSETDDRIVEGRIGSLQQDAAVNWDNPARLRVLGRAVVNERRAQGERKGWDKEETETRVRRNASDFYATAIEAAMDRDLDRAGKLLSEARDMLLPERQVLLTRKLAEAREDRHVTGIAGTLAALPLDPATPPKPEAYRARAEELTPDDASPELRARIALLTGTVQRHATKYWQHDRNRAGLAAIDWIVANPGVPAVTMDRKIAAQLSPEQRVRLQEIEAKGRLDTDPEAYARLDRLAVYDPKAFAAIDLSQYRLALDGKDYTRFSAFQKSDVAFARYDRGRTVLDAGLVKANLDPEGAEARVARGELDKTLRSFETIEGRPPTMSDIDRVAGDIVQKTTPPARSDGFSVEPPSGNPEYEAARRQLQGLELRGVKPPLEAAAMAVGAASAGESIPALVTATGKAFVGGIARAVPTLAASAAAPATFASIALLPTNSQGNFVDLGDGLRAHHPPGQRTVDIERRVDNGLVGSGFLAKWERLPVDAEYGTGPDGQRTLMVDSKKLASIIGAEPMDRLLAVPGVATANQANERAATTASLEDPSNGTVATDLIPHVLEVRVGISEDGGKTVSHLELTDEEVTRYCPSYLEFQDIGLQAGRAVAATGLQNGKDYGQAVHLRARDDVRKIAAVQAMLENRGIHELQSEFGILNGRQQGYRIRGTSVLDVLEISDTGTGCVYDFKTGNARFTKSTIEQYGEETGEYMRLKGYPYTRVFVVRIQVP